jgi:hypothetical protein
LQHGFGIRDIGNNKPCHASVQRDRFVGIAINAGDGEAVRRSSFARPRKNERTGFLGPSLRMISSPNPL